MNNKLNILTSYTGRKCVNIFFLIDILWFLLNQALGAFYNLSLLEMGLVDKLVTSSFLIWEKMHDPVLTMMAIFVYPNDFHEDIYFWQDLLVLSVVFMYVYIALFILCKIFMFGRSLAKIIRVKF